MALDTREKRSSAISVGLPWRGRLHAPDGAVNQADRQQAGLMYAGILAAGVVIPVPAGLQIAIARLTLVSEPEAALDAVSHRQGVLVQTSEPTGSITR